MFYVIYQTWNTRTIQNNVFHVFIACAKKHGIDRCKKGTLEIYYYNLKKSNLNEKQEVKSADF